MLLLVSLILFWFLIIIFVWFGAFLVGRVVFFLSLSFRRGDLLPRARNGRLRHKERVLSSSQQIHMGNPDQPCRAAAQSCATGEAPSQHPGRTQSNYNPSNRLQTTRKGVFCRAGELVATSGSPS